MSENLALNTIHCVVILITAIGQVMLQYIAWKVSSLARDMRCGKVTRFSKVAKGDIVDYCTAASVELRFEGPGTNVDVDLASDQHARFASTTVHPKPALVSVAHYHQIATIMCLDTYSITVVVPPQQGCIPHD